MPVDRKSKSAYLPGFMGALVGRAGGVGVNTLSLNPSAVVLPDQMV